MFSLNTTLLCVCLSVDLLQLNSDNDAVLGWLGSTELGWQKCHLLELAICTGVKGCAIGFSMLLNQ